PSEPVHVGGELVVRSEATTGGAAKRKQELVTDARCRERDRQRVTRNPETNALHREASYASSAGADNACNASRTDGNTSTTCLKRAMSKISATTGCNAATAI